MNALRQVGKLILISDIAKLTKGSGCLPWQPYVLCRSILHSLDSCPSHKMRVPSDGEFIPIPRYDKATRPLQRRNPPLHPFGFKQQALPDQAELASNTLHQM